MHEPDYPVASESCYAGSRIAILISTLFKVNRIAQNRNTYAKRQREQEKRQKADDKRRKREIRTSRPLAAEPSLNIISEINSPLLPGAPGESSEPGLSG